MAVWKYIAIQRGSTSSVKRRGELVANTSADARASLRRIGLQVIEIRPQHRIRIHYKGLPLFKILDSQLRRRRSTDRAELYDSMATMLEAGLPLLEVIETAIESVTGKRSSLRQMLIQVQAAINSGSTLTDALEVHTSWFSQVEIAMIAAGIHGGTLPTVLQTLGEREQHSDDLSNKLVGALTYPFVVTLAAIGVMIFLSTKTLPDLSAMLTQASVPVPHLTQILILTGQFISKYWFMCIGSLFIISIAMLVTFQWIIQRGTYTAELLTRCVPRVLRCKAVGELAMSLSELLRAGVPLVESLRLSVPIVPILFRSSVQHAADRLEQGDPPSEALTDEQRWFTPEFTCLMHTGQTAGDLDVVLERIGLRYQRRAHRLIDRVALILEPLAIMFVATLVGLVVIAAILPLIRLQEIIS